MSIFKEYILCLKTYYFYCVVAMLLLFTINALVWAVVSFYFSKRIMESCIFVKNSLPPS